MKELCLSLFTVCLMTFACFGDISEKELAQRILSGDSVYATNMFEFLLKNSPKMLKTSVSGMLWSMKCKRMCFSSKYFDFIIFVYNDSDVIKMYFKFLIKPEEKIFCNDNMQMTAMFFCVLMSNRSNDNIFKLNINELTIIQYAEVLLSYLEQNNDFFKLELLQNDEYKKFVPLVE
jgi:hypothetical protein